MDPANPAPAIEPFAGERGLRALQVAQFCGAFNDNAWKLFVITLMSATLEHGAAAEAQRQATIAFAVFTLPLMLFSLPAGALADRVSKGALLGWIKAAELALMIAGAALLFAAPGQSAPVLAVLGLLGVSSAVFSPAKYGILPELVPHEKLSLANGRIELFTFVAIIAGTALGPVLVTRLGPPGVAGIVLSAIAALGFLASLRIPRTPPARSGGGVAATVRTAVAAIRADRALALSLLGMTWFWAIASLLGQDLLVYARSELGLSEAMTGMPLALFGLGVGVGSFAAGKLSDGKVELGLIPLGSVIFAALMLVLGAVGPGLGGTCVLLALLGAASGLLVVPLNAIVQWRAPATHRGAVIAISNVLIFGGMLGGSLLGGWLAALGLSARGIVIGSAALTIAGTAATLWLLPAALLRIAVFLFTHTLYRLKVIGREHVPAEGGALLAPNHVSFADALFLIAAIDRPIRFVVDRQQYERPALKPFLKLLRAIPISQLGGPKEILRSLREAGEWLDKGELVCIFPEGQITRTGAMQPFRRGIEKIARGRAAPIVPVHLDRVWGSIFSFSGGRFTWKLPERIPYPVTLSFGAPLPAGSGAADVRRAVSELGERAWLRRAEDAQPLHRRFIASARRRPFRLCLVDAQRGKLGRLAALARAVALARALREAWGSSPRVAILLPPSIAGALANVAASLSGRTSVNLNYTAGSAGLESALAQTGIASVLTSRAFLEASGVALPAGVQPIFLDDLHVEGGLAATLAAALLPAGRLERFCGAAREVRIGDLATIIFSSGSTGTPKGVMLSHFNVESDIEAVAQVFRLSPADRLLGALPLFHSFGTFALWFGLGQGAALVCHPNPLDAAAIGELVYAHSVTLLLATPTFLQLYARRIPPELLGSVRIVMAGAEKLTDRVATAFEEAFGIRPLEGYGATECAPVIAASVPGFRARGFFQPGSRRGFVGPPLPCMTVRIVDAETFAELPPDTPGMLIVRGPNVMRGYLGREDLTAKVIRDGWYVTGDIALLDADGFLRITDRLSRFSKIGGEMVPHGKVEEALHEALGQSLPQAFAVCGLPDEKKGERLAVLTTIAVDRIPAVLEKLKTLGLPNLFIPREDAFVRVDALPMLGTGKLDLQALKRIAAEQTAS